MFSRLSTMVKKPSASRIMNMKAPTVTSIEVSCNRLRFMLHRLFPSTSLGNILRFQKALHNFVLRPDKLLRRRHLDDPALVQHGDPRADGQRAVQVVRHHHAGHAQLAAQAVDQRGRSCATSPGPGPDVGSS